MDSTLPPAPATANRTRGLVLVASFLTHDALVSAYFLTLAGLLALFLLPALSPTQKATLGQVYLPPVCVAWAIAGCCFRFRRISTHAERRFWRWIGIGLGGWLAALLPFTLGRFSLGWLSLGASIADGLFLASYIPLFLALEIQPHTGRRSEIAGRERRLTVAGLICLIVGWIVYAEVVRSVQGWSLHSGLLPSRFVFVVLDLLLFARVVMLVRSGKHFRWRAVDLALLLGVTGLTLLNALACLAQTGLLGADPRRPLSVLWTIASMGFVVASRLRDLPAVDVAPDGSEQEAFPTGDEPIWAGSLLVSGAFSFPVAHVTLQAMALLPPQVERLESLVVAVSMLVLGGLAVMVYRTLDKQRAGLQRERDQLERRFIQTQKMEAVGRLAGGIAHDFNNLLTAIGGYADLASESLAPASAAREPLEEVRLAADRAASLTRQLLAFSRRQLLKPQPLHLNRTIRNLEGALRQVIGARVELRTFLHPDLGWTSADASQIEQVLLNLVVNARDAMPRGGTITIATANGEWREDDVRERPGHAPGPCVRLEVTDTGAGIPAEVLPKIFEPFFTTKTAGEGTGLGLSMVYGIVRQSGGLVTVTSQEQVGTTFSISLPRVPDPPVEAATTDTPLTSRGTETILLVEDETAVRELARSMLVRHGYTVIAAASGEEAVRVLARHHGRLDLLLTDVVMPGMSGPELASQVLAQRPDLRVLLMTGYTDAAVVHHGVIEGVFALLHKPFSQRTITASVRSALDRAPKSAGPASPPPNGPGGVS